MSRVLFIEIDTERSWALASVGPGYIASYVRRRGHEASLLRVAPDRALADVVRDVETDAPGLVGFSLTTRQWRRAASVARETRRTLSVPLIAGGLHATFAPETVLDSDGFDCVCLGEGEAAVAELLDFLDQGGDVCEANVANIWVKGADRPELRPRVEHLDGLPFAARDLLDENHGVVHVSTQRGCPFACAFCAAVAISDLYGGGTRVRRRGVENVLSELHEVRRNGPLNYVVFLDDTFTVGVSWLREFCPTYQREVGTPFSVNARVESVSPELIGLLVEAGCRHIVYGVESGSPRVRREVLNRAGDNECIINAFRWARNAGLLVTANYMIGLPGETREDIEQTLALNDELQPDDFGYFVFYPYPGTKLFQVCHDAGFLPEEWASLPANNRQSILNLPGLPKEVIGEYYNAFTRARERLYMQRHGGALGADQEAEVSLGLRESAATA